jgi:hypothetical protein
MIKMTDCSKCGKRIKMFETSYSCDFDECDEKVCGNCYSKVSGWNDCEWCENSYCPKHLETKSHNCEEYSEDESEDKRTVDECITYSEDKSIAYLDVVSGISIKDEANKIAELYKEGYELVIRAVNPVEESSYLILVNKKLIKVI